MARRQTLHKILKTEITKKWVVWSKVHWMVKQNLLHSLLFMVSIHSVMCHYGQKKVERDCDTENWNWSVVIYDTYNPILNFENNKKNLLRGFLQFYVFEPLLVQSQHCKQHPFIKEIIIVHVTSNWFISVNEFDTNENVMLSRRKRKATWQSCSDF